MKDQTAPLQESNSLYPSLRVIRAIMNTILMKAVNSKSQFQAGIQKFLRRHLAVPAHFVSLFVEVSFALRIDIHV